MNHRGKTLTWVDNWRVVECIDCGFRHILPIPYEEDLRKIYKSGYYEEQKPEYIQNHEKDRSWWNLVYDERLANLERLCGDKPGRLLDIGSGPGFFLARAKSRGWAALGIEPNRTAVEFSRSLDVPVIEYEIEKEMGYRTGQFDVIHMSEVMEHLPDPIGMMEMAGLRLAENGLVCVVVPNDYNVIQCALAEKGGFKPWWVAPPFHINYFDFQSMEKLFERTGFEVVLKESTFPIDMFLLMGDNYVNNPSVGREAHRRRMAFETNVAAWGLEEMKREMYWYFAELGLGREIVMIGRKLRS